MAITMIRCPKCNFAVSDKAEKCPKCTHTLSESIVDKIKDKIKGEK